MHRWRGIHIGKHVYVGQLCVLDNAYPEYIYIEDHASMAGEVSVIAHVNPCEHFSFMLEAKVAPVVIKEGGMDWHPVCHLTGSQHWDEINRFGGYCGGL